MWDHVLDDPRLCVGRVEIVGDCVELAAVRSYGAEADELNLSMGLVVLCIDPESHPITQTFQASSWPPRAAVASQRK